MMDRLARPGVAPRGDGRLTLAGIASVAVCAAGLCLALAGGCLVQSRCMAHYDCSGNEICDLQLGECRLECQSNSDCLTRGMVCLDNHCEIPGDRVKASNFCLKVVNEKSPHFDKDLCLEQLAGKVVLIYFALLS